jgi:2-aminoadipate transaminase
MWIGFFAWYRGLALGGTVRVSQVQLVQPFFSMLMAVPLLGERLDALTLGFRRGGDRHRVPGPPDARPEPHDNHDTDKQRNPMTNWTLAARAHKMNPSVIREILKVTEKPGIISFAGGLPSPKTFPVDAMLEATQRVLTQDGRSALQYAASEGYGPLRDWVAHDLKKQGMDVHADQVLITTGSQQGLDLVAKILIDAGSRILVETPTYLGALQAFTPMEPDVVSVDSDDSGVLADDLRAKAGQGAARARFIYLLPNFQNPTGRTMTEARRAAVAAAAQRAGVPLIEDNPYGDLWFDAAPPPSLSSRWPEGSVYLGSFSKILAPGLRLGYLVAPPALYPKLLQAKQAADLHTPGFNQRLVAEVLKDGFIERHVPTIRALYKQQCEAMLAALGRACPKVWTPWACCPRRWTGAWPSCLGPRSTPTTAIRARCGCPS